MEVVKLGESKSYQSEQDQPGFETIELVVLVSDGADEELDR